MFSHGDPLVKHEKGGANVFDEEGRLLSLLTARLRKVAKKVTCPLFPHYQKSIPFLSSFIYRSLRPPHPASPSKHAMTAWLTVNEIIRDYYPDLTIEAIRACVQYAIALVAADDIHLTPSSA